MYDMFLTQSFFSTSVTKGVSPNANSINVDSTYNATQWAAYEARQPSAYTVPHNLSTVFTGVSLRDISASGDEWQAIVAEATTRDAAALLPPGVEGDATVLAGYRAQREILLRSLAHAQDSALALLYFDTYSSAQAYHMKPLSRGRIAIADAAPLTPPLIDYGTATDPTDLRVGAALLRKMREVMAQPAMQALGPVEIAPYATDKGVPITDEAGIEQALRQNLLISNAHQCCSNPMQPRALGGVVDPAMKVYGVTGLRVGDISTFPISVSGGPTPSVYGISEKVSHAPAALHPSQILDTMDSLLMT